MDIHENFSQEPGICQLKKRSDLICIAINDQADKAIYPIGTIGFCRNQTEKIYINTESVAGRDAYAAQWTKNRQWLYEMTSRLKIPLIELSTESDPRRDLIQGLKAIAKRKKR